MNLRGWGRCDCYLNLISPLRKHVLVNEDVYHIFRVGDRGSGIRSWCAHTGQLCVGDFVRIYWSRSQNLHIRGVHAVSVMITGHG